MVLQQYTCCPRFECRACIIQCKHLELCALHMWPDLEQKTLLAKIVLRYKPKNIWSHKSCWGWVEFIRIKEQFQVSLWWRFCVYMYLPFCSSVTAFVASYLCWLYTHVVFSEWSTMIYSHDHYGCMLTRLATCMLRL